MGDSVQDDKAYVQDKAQWSVGIAMLRKTRHLVDGFERDEQFKQTAAKYVTAGLALVLGFVLVTALFFPAVLRTLLRSVS